MISYMIFLFWTVCVVGWVLSAGRVTRMMYCNGEFVDAILSACAFALATAMSLKNAIEAVQ